MAFSKIIYNGTTLMDVTGDTVTASVLNSGYTAHDASGTQITGTGSGGGGGSSWTLLASTETTQNITTTSNQSIGLSLTADGAWNAYKLLYVRIRDKAGKRSGYYLGSDIFFMPAEALTSATVSYNAITFTYKWDGASYVVNKNTTGYGITVYSVSDTSGGRVTFYGRYSSTYSGTIDGTYKIEVYSLAYPDGISPFDI